MLTNECDEAGAVDYAQVMAVSREPAGPRSEEAPPRKTPLSRTHVATRGPSPISRPTSNTGDMPRPQIEKTYPEYALAYLRYLAGARDTAPTTNRDANGAVQYREISRSQIALAQLRRVSTNSCERPPPPELNDVTGHGGL